jgi:hypothetical protein
MAKTRKSTKCPGPLGWISPKKRNQQQHAAHYAALSHMPKFAIQNFTEPGGPVKIILTDFWKNPDVVADVGFEFNGFHQLTGSCFIGSTPVLMADGSRKPIVSVKLGDEVYTRYGKKTRVVRTFQRSYSGQMVRVSSDAGEPVVMTADHKVSVGDNDTGRDVWVDAGTLLRGGVSRNPWGVPLRTGVGSYARMRHITGRDVTNHTVYDFEVEDDDHSFIADWLTVHNCVGASAGNWVFTLGAVQRTVAENPTKAFVPWWPFFYGRTRYNEGDRGRGEGAIDSVMAETCRKEGVFAATESGLPQFDKSDGLTLTSNLELEWSDGGSSTVTKWMQTGSQHLLGTTAPLNSPQDIRAAIINGYPVIDGCDNYVGHGSIKGSGDNAYVTGHYDGRGGHSTCILGYWDHPNDGPLYLYSNQWPSQTYPKDPAGAGRCCVWLPESEMQKLFRTGGDGETFAGSALQWFPAQPKILEWSRLA